MTKQQQNNVYRLAKAIGGTQRAVQELRKMEPAPLLYIKELEAMVEKLVYYLKNEIDVDRE